MLGGVVGKVLKQKIGSSLANYLANSLVLFGIHIRSKWQCELSKVTQSIGDTAVSIKVLHTMVCLSLSDRMRGRRYLLHRSKGFRLRKRRLGVSGLRVRVLHFIRLMCRWKWKSTSSCKEGSKLMIKQGKHAPSRSNDKKNYCSGGTTTSDLRIRRGMGKEGCASKIGDTCRNSMSFDLSSSSFYSEAIADCLEFIKMSALSADDQSIELSTS